MTTGQPTNDPQLFLQFVEWQKVHQAPAGAQPDAAVLPPSDAPAADTAAPAQRSRHRQRQWSVPAFRPTFDARALGRAIGPFFAFVNFIGLAISWSTTIGAVCWAEYILRGGAQGGRVTWIGVLVGMLTAGTLMLGQWVCLNGFRYSWYGVRWRWLVGYALCLIPDVMISFWMSWVWAIGPLTVAAVAKLSEEAARLVSWIVAVVNGLISLGSSIAPELFLFGRKGR